MAHNSSEASPSLTPNWFEIHANPIASWNSMNGWQPPPPPPQPPAVASASEEDMPNISTNHSSLTIDSSVTTEPVENHIWSQVLLSTGGEMHNSHDDGGNFLELLSSKNMTVEMFDPACDYLKKLDSSWEFTSHQVHNDGLEKQLSTFSNLSEPASNWSIAPPNPQIDNRFLTSANVPMNSSSHYAFNSHIKHEIPSSLSTYLSNGAVDQHLQYLHDMKGESQHQEVPSFLRQLSSNANNIGYHIGFNNLFPGINSNWSNTRNLTDPISFSSSLKSPMEFRAVAKAPLKVPELTDSKKHGHDSLMSKQARGGGRSPVASADGKKKRAEDNSDTVMKKSKQDSSSIVSSSKLQVPKAKVADRITALQQIVSPFGKTDTASVLMEAINHIRFLQEQVQMLSDPYMKSGANKDRISWSAFERKEKTQQNHDLRSRGLCLVPISCTPQACRENNGPDFWTPTYRGCMFR